MDTPQLSQQDFAEIYNTHHRRVLRLCRYLLNSNDAAADAAHEVFLRAQNKLAGYDPSLPISSWLLGIASNLCIDLLRRRGLETRLFDLESGDEFQPMSHGPSPLAEVLAAERGDAVRQALTELPEKLRIPLVLAYYNELRYDEIADTLGLKRAHVATLLFRAKQQMRQKLADKEKKHGLSR